jgi:glycosyltransferase involved in cell wall biosynthesis
VTEPVRVSVVIPVFNAAATLAATLRSVLASELRELEILVIDDGSTDASVDIAQAIGDTRIRVLREHASGGPARPRNVGIFNARAPYIALLDADDLLKPDKLSASVAALEQHPQAGFAFADFEKIDADGKLLEPSVVAYKLAACRLASTPLADSWSLISQSELARGFLYRNFLTPSGVVLRKSVLGEVGGFDETLVYSEDLDLWFRLAHHCSALYSSRVGHSYRVAAGSLTYRPSVRTARDRITALLRERARRRQHAERRQIDRLLAETQATLGWEYRRGRRRLRAAAAFAQALLRQPRVRWMRALLGSLVLQPPR